MAKVVLRPKGGVLEKILQILDSNNDKQVKLKIC
jgi:hypothetical protein